MEGIENICLGADPRVKFAHLATLAIDFHSRSDKKTVTTIFRFLLQKMMYHDTFNPAFVALEKIIFECPAYLYEYQKSFIPDFVDCFLKYFDEMSVDQFITSYEYFRSDFNVF